VVMMKESDSHMAGSGLWLKIMKDPRWKLKEFVAEITTKVEFFLAVGSIISLALNLNNDWQEWHGGS